MYIDRKYYLIIVIALIGFIILWSIAAIDMTNKQVEVPSFLLDGIKVSLGAFLGLLINSHPSMKDKE